MLSVDVSGEESKIQYCKEQYYIGTWNVRFMNQGKWDMVKQEMVRISIPEISELKMDGMGEINSDDHYINYYEQESHRRNEIILIINKRVWNTVLGYNLKNDRMILVHFQGKPVKITVIQVYAPPTDVEEAEQFYEDLLELTQKRMSFLS